MCPYDLQISTVIRCSRYRSHLKPLRYVFSIPSRVKPVRYVFLALSSCEILTVRVLGSVLVWNPYSTCSWLCPRVKSLQYVFLALSSCEILTVRVLGSVLVWNPYSTCSLVCVLCSVLVWKRYSTCSLFCPRVKPVRYVFLALSRCNSEPNQEIRKYSSWRQTEGSVVRTCHYPRYCESNAEIWRSLKHVRSSYKLCLCSPEPRHVYHDEWYSKR